MNEANITTLLGHAPADHPAGDKAPTGDGRADVVFGNTYVYLPTDTPVLDTEPSTHLGTTSTQKLDTALWVQIAYAGSATLTSYYALGDQAGIQIGQRSDAEAEYKLYTTANERHTKAVQDKPTEKSSPSGWYELLRFGRNLGRGPAASDKDPLPANAEHWRKICTPAGEKWANLNAKGTLKFSDADFPSFLGWQCFSDDENTTDQRCDSPTLRSLLAVSIDDMAEREKALKKTLAGRDMLAKQLKSAKLKDKLPRLICKYPSEFDQGELEARYGHVKEEDEFKNNQKNWDQFQAHIKALTHKSAEKDKDNGLPMDYINAQWHVHPVAFINHISKCWRIQKSDLKRIFTAFSDAHLTAVVNEINQFSGKHFLNTGLRQAHFFGQIRQEAGAGMSATVESLDFAFDRLGPLFKYYRDHPTEAHQDGRTETHSANQQSIANKAYGLRNGNSEPGDGWLYRGRGMKQITGKGNYQEFQNKYRLYWATGQQDFLASPALVVNMPYALRSAVWFFVGQGCVKQADKGIADEHINAVTNIVNSYDLEQNKANRRTYAKDAYKILN